MLDEAREIGVHVAMARKGLRAFGEFEIPEVRELLRRVDVKRLVSGGEAIVVVEAPKAAHLRADLVDRHVKAGLLEISRRAKARGSRPDDRDALRGASRRAAFQSHPSSAKPGGGRDLRMSKAAFANGPGAKRHHACLTVDGIVLSFTGIILRPQLVIHAVCAAVCR